MKLRRKSISQAMLRLDRFMGGDGFESPTRVLPGLFLGGQGEARDLGLLRSLGVTHIVNCSVQVRLRLTLTSYLSFCFLTTTHRCLLVVSLSLLLHHSFVARWFGGAQLPNYFEDASPAVFAYEDLDGGIRDAPDASIAPYLERAADFTARALALGGGVYVHCIAGMSRSVTIVLAYLVKHGGFTLKAAFERCRARRYIIDPNKTFLCEIALFEVKHKGGTSVYSHGPWVKSKPWLARRAMYTQLKVSPGSGGGGEGGSSVCAIQ